jgi:hypothetical protein
VTPGAPPPQDLAAATFRGWGELTTAWISVAERWWFTILEWATDECAYTGVNQTAAFANVDTATQLRGEFYRADDPSKALIFDTCVTIARTTDAALAQGAAQFANVGGANANAAAANANAGAANADVLLLVTIQPGFGVGPGGYRGAVVDKITGAPLAESLYVYVATDSTPITTTLTP